MQVYQSLQALPKSNNMSLINQSSDQSSYNLHNKSQQSVGSSHVIKSQHNLSGQQLAPGQQETSF